MPYVIVNVIDQQTDLQIPLEQVENIAKQVIEDEGQTCDEVNIYFVDTEAISDLHNQFFNDPSPTDCISFPIDEEENQMLPYRILGEVFVCPATAVEYAKKNQKDPLEETTLYIVHGLLHLMGYDDLNGEDRKIMQKTQTAHMRKLKKLRLQLRA